MERYYLALSRLVSRHRAVVIPNIQSWFLALTRFISRCLGSFQATTAHRELAGYRVEGAPGRLTGYQEGGRGVGSGMGITIGSPGGFWRRERSVERSEVRFWGNLPAGVSGAPGLLPCVPWVALPEAIYTHTPAGHTQRTRAHMRTHMRTHTRW